VPPTALTSVDAPDETFGAAYARSGGCPCSKRGRNEPGAASLVLWGFLTMAGDALGLELSGSWAALEATRAVRCGGGSP
jgi:hypothetical protein